MKLPGASDNVDPVPGGSEKHPVVLSVRRSQHAFQNPVFILQFHLAPVQLIHLQGNAVGLGIRKILPDTLLLHHRRQKLILAVPVKIPDGIHDDPLLVMYRVLSQGTVLHHIIAGKGSQTAASQLRNQSLLRVFLQIRP